MEPIVCKKRVVFDDFYRQDQRDLNRKNKEIYLEILEQTQLKFPSFKPLQIKALTVESFLNAANINICCIEKKGENGYGIAIFHKETKEQLGFIRNNCVVVNALNKLYYSGCFDSAKLIE